MHSRSIAPTSASGRDPQPVLERDVHHYREFWFGNLDNLRIRYPLGTLRTPTLLVHAPERARGERWTPVDEGRLRFTVDAEYLE